jgi:hypothetical protein
MKNYLQSACEGDELDERKKNLFSEEGQPIRLALQGTFVGERKPAAFPHVF